MGRENILYTSMPDVGDGPLFTDVKFWAKQFENPCHKISWKFSNYD